MADWAESFNNWNYDYLILPDLSDPVLEQGCQWNSYADAESTGSPATDENDGLEVETMYVGLPIERLNLSLKINLKRG